MEALTFHSQAVTVAPITPQEEALKGAGVVPVYTSHLPPTYRAYPLNISLMFTILLGPIMLLTVRGQEYWAYSLLPDQSSILAGLPPSETQASDIGFSMCHLLLSLRAAMPWQGETGLLSVACVLLPP